MQMARVYCEQRVAYEYVKWEMKQNKKYELERTVREKERKKVGRGGRSSEQLNWKTGNGLGTDLYGCI